MSRFVLKLYITGRTQRSEQAVRNLVEVCESYLPGQYELSVVDVLERPGLAEEQRILATPVLCKLDPPPPRRIVGDLSDKEKLVGSLDLEGIEAREEMCRNNDGKE